MLLRYGPPTVPVGTATFSPNGNVGDLMSVASFATGANISAAPGVGVRGWTSAVPFSVALRDFDVEVSDIE